MPYCPSTRHELDEHVLQAGFARVTVIALCLRASASAASSARCRSRRHAASAPNGATWSTPCACRSASATGSRRGPARRKVRQPGIADHLVDGAVRQHLAIGDVADAVAALGLVHVMGRDQHGQPAAGQPMDLVPEFAPRLRVDAGRRLVEQQQLGLVHDAGGRAPAAASSRRTACRQAGPARCRGRARPSVLRAASRRLQHAIEPRHEFEIFARSSDPRRTRISASCSRLRA